jgi:hypothetical protein
VAKKESPVTRKNQKRSCIALALALVLSLAGLGLSAPFNRMESACFYFPDGKTIHLPLVHQPSRSDNLSIRAALVETATQHRAAAIASGKLSGYEDRMVFAAMTEQWTEGGLSCAYAVSRSGGRGYDCTCNATGTKCIRVVVQSGSGPMDGPVPPPDLHQIEIKK